MKTTHTLRRAGLAAAALLAGLCSGVAQTPPPNPFAPLSQLTTEHEADLVTLQRALTRKSLNSAAAANESAVQHLTAEAAQKLLADNAVVVLDIRTPDEFRGGHIPGATNINFRAADFEKQIAALPKETVYLVHCASGNRSTQALPVFRKLNFKAIRHLDGGMKAWEKAELPVAK